MVNRKEALEILVPILVFFTANLIGLFILGSQGGFSVQNYIQRTSFYFGLSLTGTLVISFYTLLKLMAKNNAFLRETFIHDPEDSQGKFLLKFISSPLKAFLFFALVFITISFIIGLTAPQNLTLSQTGLIEQQVSKTGEFLISTYPTADGETLTIQAVLLTLFGIVGVLSKKRKDLRQPLIISSIILVGFLWAIFHTAVYGNDQVAFGLTILFGLIGGLLTWFFKSIIPFIVWHQVHNLFSKSFDLFSDQIALIGFGVVWVILLVLYIRLMSQKSLKPIGE